MVNYFCNDGKPTCCLSSVRHILTCASLSVGKAVILCQNSKKDFFKKFLYEPLPVEVSLVPETTPDRDLGPFY